MSDVNGSVNCSRPIAASPTMLVGVSWDAGTTDFQWKGALSGGATSLVIPFLLLDEDREIMYLDVDGHIHVAPDLTENRLDALLAQFQHEGGPEILAKALFRLSRR